jgi:hypothetical protein
MYTVDAKKQKQNWFYDFIYYTLQVPEIITCDIYELCKLLALSVQSKNIEDSSENESEIRSNSQLEAQNN